VAAILLERFPCFPVYVCGTRLVGTANLSCSQNDKYYSTVFAVLHFEISAILVASLALDYQAKVG
jgi:NADH:ubiquinone oxidoreductase subunit 3 (subunit A)